MISVNQLDFSINISDEFLTLLGQNTDLNWSVPPVTEEADDADGATSFDTYVDNIEMLNSDPVLPSTPVVLPDAPSASVVEVPEVDTSLDIDFSGTLDTFDFAIPAATDLDVSASAFAGVETATVSASATLSGGGSIGGEAFGVVGSSTSIASVDIGTDTSSAIAFDVFDF